METLKPKVERLESILDSLRHPYGLISSSIYEQLGTVAIKLAERITEEAVAIDKSKLLAFIEQAVLLLPDEQADIEIELHPDDVELVNYYQAEHSRGWLIKTNAKLQVGECRVKKLNSIVHHQWRERLANLLAQTEPMVLASQLADNAQTSTQASQPSNASSQSGDANA